MSSTIVNSTSVKPSSPARRRWTRSTNLRRGRAESTGLLSDGSLTRFSSTWTPRGRIAPPRLVASIDQFGSGADVGEHVVYLDLPTRAQLPRVPAAVLRDDAVVGRGRVAGGGDARADRGGHAAHVDRAGDPNGRREGLVVRRLQLCGGHAHVAVVRVAGREVRVGGRGRTGDVVGVVRLDVRQH